jgi:hypothetical protein
MGIVNIQGIGGVEFPDDMSPQDIQTAIEKDILPKFPEIAAKGKRSWGEAATDIGGGFISGVGSLLQLPGQIGQLAGITEREETPTGLQGIGKQVEEYGQELKSPVLKGKEAVRAQRVAAAGEEGGLKGMASQFGTAIKETITDPALITSFFAEQVPNLFGSMGGGLLAKGGVKLLMSDAVKASLGKAGIESAAGKAGVAGAVGTGAVMQGADVGYDTYEALYKRLAKEQPDMSPEERNRIALAQGRQAGLEAAGISLATAALPGGRSIERALAGKGAPSVGGVARGFLGEAGSESLEEGGGQFVSNVAQQQVFPDVSLTQNVGQAAGMGALGGGLFGGIAGGVNARNEAQRQVGLEEIEQQRQLALQAEEATRVAEYQARADAEQARLAEISHRGWVERGGATNTQAFADLSNQVEELKAKAAASAARANAARDKVDAQKAKLSAFSQAQPDLLGDVLPPQQTAAAPEPVQQGVPAAPEGQLELPLTDAEGQLGLPGIGGAINAPPAAPTPEPVEAMVVTQDLTRALGIAGGNKRVRNAIEGKDLTDPKQRAEVKQELEDFAGRTTRPNVASNIETFLGLPIFAEQGELTLPMRRVSAKQRAAAKTEELAGLFGAKLAQAEGVKVPSQELPYQREAKTTEDKLQNVFGNQLRQTQGIPVSDNLLPHEREAANVTPTQPTTTQPAAQQPAGGQSVGMASVGAGPTTQQTSAAAGVQGAGSTGLAPSTAGTQRNVRGAATTPTAIDKKLKGAAKFEAEYLVEANGDPVQMLRFLAADLYAGVNMRRANPVYKTLSAEEKAEVDRQIAGLKELERKGMKALKKLNDEQAYQRSIESGKIPTPEVVVDELKGNTTPGLIAATHKGSVTYALSEIANGKGFSPLEQLIAKRLLSNKRYSLPKIKIVPAGSLGKADGQYDPYTDSISIVEGAVDSHTILHEAVHGFVHSLITKFESGEISNRALVDLQDLYNHLLQNNPELAAQYGMRSLTEFAAEAMSNPEFQAALARIPYKQRNVFQEFAKFVMDLLGLSGTNNALAEAIINVERAMNIGRGTQENVSGTAKAPPIANVARKADLEALNTAAGGRPTGKGNPNPVGSAITQNAKASEANAARRITTFLDAFETGALSFDAALNNSIRRELNKDKKDWNVIKDVLTKISTSQALHSDAMAMQFLEHGKLRYDPKTYKFFAEDDKDSWKNMMALMSSVAKRNGLTDTELRTYANTAFIAERVEGLAKSNPEFHKHLTPQQTAAGKQLFDKIDGLRDVQAMWNGIRKNAMDAAVENGLYSREEADYLLQYNDFVPFYREDQLEVGAGPRKYPNGFIDFAKNFKIKGSDQPVSDVFGNMAIWTTYTVSRAVRNRAALNMYGAVKEVMPDQVEDIRQDESVKREDNVVQFRENGQIKKVKFADPLFVHAFEGMETVAIPILKNFAKATNFLRQSIVLNPLFSLSQLSQDSFAAMMSSGLKNPLMIPLEVMRQFNGILFGKNATGKYLSRAGVVGINDYMSSISNNNLEIATGLKKKSRFQKLLSPLEKFSMASDNAVRQALYNRTLLETGGKRQPDGTVKGGDEAAAMERAFEIINFKRSGANGIVNFGKQLVPFFGAYLQAMNVTAKVLSGRSITPTERAAAYRTLLWNTMMVTTLAFLYSAMVSGDDDYEKMDPQVRDKHLIIPGTSFMLPLRNDFTLFPKLAAEYSYLMMTDNGFTDGKKVRRAMGDALANAILSPTVVPQALKPALEVGINHNFFTGREVVGKGIAGRDKEFQYTESTSELGKFLGKMGILAPVQIDHLIKGYAGTVGGLGLMTANAIMSQGNAPKPEKATQDELRQIPGMSTFFASSHGNAMKNDYYELREEVASAVKSMNFLKDKSPEEARAYIKEKMPLLQLQGPINNINNQLTKIRKYEEQVRALPESRMNAAEKKAVLDRIKESEDRMLKNVYKLRNMAGY